MTATSTSSSRTIDLSRVDWRRVERLEWVQPRALHDLWRLLADGVPAAELRAKSLWKNGWLARTHDAEWTIADPVFGAPHITRADESEPAARARLRMFAPIPIERAAGPALGWRLADWASRTRVLATSEKLPLVTVRSRFRWLRTEAEVLLEDAGRELPDLEALVLLVWGLVLSRRRSRS